MPSLEANTAEHAGEPCVGKARIGARVALAHDWMVGYRGGEAVLEAIARCVAAQGQEITRVYTMFDSGAKLSSVLDAIPRRVSSLNRWPDRARRWLLPLYPRAVEELSRQLARDHVESPIDLVISTSSAAIKGLRAPEGVPHLCYCHSPARYLWSQAEQYGLGRGGMLRRAGLRVFGARLRAWDKRTAANVTRFLANSSHTGAEIQRCYGRDSDVVWPPVRVEYFGGIGIQADGDSSGWLYAGALEPYKRVDLAIHAANQSKTPLTIVGDGSQAAHLRTIAGPTVRFAGRVSDEQLREQYRRASLVLFPQIEDFGIVAVEAQACGTPVLAFGAGGALDSVIEGQTGEFFHEHTAEALIAAAARVPRKSAAVSAACRANASRFSESHFTEALTRHASELLSASRPRAT